MKRRAEAARLANQARSRYARVEGTVEGRRSVAIVYQDGSVAAEPALLERVGLVVSLGDTFGGGEIEASVGRDPLISTLATARACDSVTVVDVFGSPSRVAPPAGSGSVPDDADDPLVIEAERGEGRIALLLRGELDLGSAEALAAQLAQRGGAELDVTVDVSQVTFVDAQGLSVLLAARRDLAARGHTLVVRGATAVVRGTFELCAHAEILED